MSLGYRVCQRRSEERGGNRHLADVRALDVPREHLVETSGVQYTDFLLTTCRAGRAVSGNDPI